MKKPRPSRWAAVIALTSAGLLSGCYYPYGYYPWGYPYPEPYAWGYPYLPPPPPPAPAGTPPTQLAPTQPAPRGPVPRCSEPHFRCNNKEAFPISNFRISSLSSSAGRGREWVEAGRGASV